MMQLPEAGPNNTMIRDGRAPPDEQASWRHTVAAPDPRSSNSPSRVHHVVEILARNPSENARSEATVLLVWQSANLGTLRWVPAR